MNLPTVLALYCWQNPQYGPSQCSVQCLGEPQPSFTSESRAELQVSFSCALALSSETTATVSSSQSDQLLAQLLCRGWPRSELKNLRYLLIQLFCYFSLMRKRISVWTEFCCVFSIKLVLVNICYVANMLCLQAYIKNINQMDII